MILPVGGPRIGGSGGGGRFVGCLRSVALLSKAHPAPPDPPIRRQQSTIRNL